jgi:hypothetical protein
MKHLYQIPNRKGIFTKEEFLEMVRVVNEDEEEEESGSIGRRFVIMKSLVAVLMGVAVLLVISSCATVPTEPLGSGELRLLGMQVPSGNLVLGLSYNIYFTFDADGKPEMSRACCYWSGDPERQYCYKVNDVKYGSPGKFSLDLSPPYPDQQRLKCYVDYVRDGKRQRTNAVTSTVN